MNILDIGLNAISNVVSNQFVTLNIFSQTIVSNSGKVSTYYTTISDVVAQIQPQSTQKIMHKDYFQQSAIYKKFYLNSNTLSGLNRNLNTAGDYITFNNLQYKIVEVVEPFNSGWIMVIGCQSNDKVTG